MGWGHVGYKDGFRRWVGVGVLLLLDWALYTHLVRKHGIVAIYTIFIYIFSRNTFEPN